jgi:Uncharacterized protein conserved in bacteria (DUF2130)
MWKIVVLQLRIGPWQNGRGGRGLLRSVSRQRSLKRSWGTILYDSKNHKQYRKDHVVKLRTDQLADKAEHAILSTHKFPEGTGQTCVRDGVILANPARVASIALIIRQHLLHVHTLCMSAIERDIWFGSVWKMQTSGTRACLGGLKPRTGGSFDVRDKSRTSLRRKGTISGANGDLSEKQLRPISEANGSYLGSNGEARFAVRLRS